MASIAEAMQVAVEYHRAGQLQQAEAIYRQVIAADARHAMAHHLLGVLAMQARQPDVAIAQIQRAIALEPNQAAFHANLGDVLRTVGRSAEAKTCFARAIALDDRQVAAHYNLGLLHQSENNLPAAIASFSKAVELMPDLAPAHNELGNLYRDQGDRQLALEHFRRAIKANPQLADAHNDLGNLLQDLGQLPEAIESFQRALALNPALAAAHYNLGNALRATGELERAEASYRGALRVAPSMALAHNNLGTLLQDRGDWDGAQREFAEAVRLAPDLAEAHYNLGVALLHRDAWGEAEAILERSIQLDPNHAPAYLQFGQAKQHLRKWDEARANYLEALRLNPSYSEPQCNLGLMAMHEARYDEALERFQTSLATAPDCAEARCNLGMLRLGAGEYDIGWADFLAYSQCPYYRDQKYSQPTWDGAPLEGRTIRIVCDNGLGDTIQFIRYVPWLYERGAGRVLLAAQVALHPLLRAAGFGELVAPDDRSEPFDTHVSVMMLPPLHYQDRQSLGDAAPYLRADEQRVAQWQSRLAEFKGLRVGICWHGNETFPWNHWRSIPLAAYAPLAEVPGVHLISLQHGPGRRQLLEQGERLSIVDLGDQVDRDCGAFMDTAAIIANLDLVITSDTSLAHVAGALGAPVWLALPAGPEWRWRWQGSSTPWYPSLKLYRQQAFNEWRPVFEQLAADLTPLMASLDRTRSSSRP